MSSSPANTRDEAATPRLFSVTAIVASCAGFVLIGVLQALYGPAIPTFLDKFQVSTAVAGFSLSAHFLGALAGVLVFHRLLGRIGNRQLLGASYGLMGLGSAGFALTSNWTVALFAAFIIGLGFGGIDYGLNQLFSVAFGRRSAAMLNLLNAHFGIGAVAGPALVSWFGADNYPWIFGGAALLSLLLIAALGGVGSGDIVRAGQVNLPMGNRRVLVLIGSFVVIYVLHVAIETGVGGWEPTHLEAVGYTVSTAAAATSVYWMAMTVGRFLVVPVSMRFSPESIVIASCVGMAACLGLASFPALAPYAYVGVGLFIAPIFPTALPWLNRSVPTVSGAGAYVIAASMIGGVAFPPLLGTAIDLSGVRALPLVLVVLALICVVMSVWLARTTREAER